METHNHSQQEVRSFSCQWMGFFSGGAFFMSMFESVFFIQHPPHNSADSGCLFSTDAETDNRDKSDMNSNHWFQHRMSLCVLHHAVGRVSSSLDWYFKWCALGFFFAMQRSWSQSNRCLSRSDSDRMSYHLPVWWTGVSPFFQCLDSSSACKSRPSRDRSLHRVSHKKSALSRALCRINHRNVGFPVPPLDSVHDIKQGGSDCFCLKYSLFMANWFLYRRAPPFLFLSVCKSIAIYCSRHGEI